MEVPPQEASMPSIRKLCPEQRKRATPIFGDPKSPFAPPPGSYRSLPADSTVPGTKAMAPFNALEFFRKLRTELSSARESPSSMSQGDEFKEENIPCAIAELKIDDSYGKTKQFELSDACKPTQPAVQTVGAEIKLQTTPNRKAESHVNSRIQLGGIFDVASSTSPRAVIQTDVEIQSATERLDQNLEPDACRPPFDSICSLRELNPGKQKEKFELSADAPSYELPTNNSNPLNRFTASRNKEGHHLKPVQHVKQTPRFDPELSVQMQYHMHRNQLMRAATNQQIDVYNAQVNARNQLTALLQTWASASSQTSNVPPSRYMGFQAPSAPVPSYMGISLSPGGMGNIMRSGFQSQTFQGGLPGTSGYVYPRRAMDTASQAQAMSAAQALINAAVQGAQMALARDTACTYKEESPLASDSAEEYEERCAYNENGVERDTPPARSLLLEEFRLHKHATLRLKDIFGHLVMFGQDQQGSRFIQQQLEVVSPQDFSTAFDEILPECLVLSNHVFGNYVIQKLLEHGTPVHASLLAHYFKNNVLDLSLHMYGCRVMQKALEVLDLKGKMKLVQELEGHVWTCLRDQNGNHVIQKCVQCIPSKLISFIIDSLLHQVRPLATHPYGCRVIQRLLEYCDDPMKKRIVVEEILHNTELLAQDQYGNYVVQHLIEHGAPHERQCVIHRLKNDIVAFSVHKFASNVVEKCLVFGTQHERCMLLTGMLRSDSQSTENSEPIHEMMKDQYGNYVVQKLLEVCSDAQRETLLNCIRSHLHALKRVTYGKHILARVEKLLATGTRLCVCNSD
ncbi:hypothetical protein BSKO_08642 [Bryopsis sp. KO-2023]|nr:hypothetical protein BSKO_08642 [Bryopsis sp. KO-2023]